MQNTLFRSVTFFQPTACDMGRGCRLNGRAAHILTIGRIAAMLATSPPAIHSSHILLSVNHIVCISASNRIRKIDLNDEVLKLMHALGDWHFFDFHLLLLYRQQFCLGSLWLPLLYCAYE